jgi:signal-transduction protein with cAMP-binding, CBS, and nucleotidyltransferase domain
MAMARIHDDHIRMLLKRPAVKVHHEATLRSVAGTFAEESIGAAVVKDTDPPGIISERDIVQALADGADPDQERAGDVMTEDIASVAPDESVMRSVSLMLDNEIRHLPVIEDGVVIGVVSARDALHSLADEVQAAG